MIELGRYIVSIGSSGMGRAGYIQWRGEGMPLVDQSGQVAIGSCPRGYAIMYDFFACVDDSMAADPPTRQPEAVTL